MVTGRLLALCFVSIFLPPPNYKQNDLGIKEWAEANWVRCRVWWRHVECSIWSRKVQGRRGVKGQHREDPGSSVQSSHSVMWVQLTSLPVHPNSWSLLKLMSTESVMHPAFSSSVIPLSSCLQSYPALGSFPMSQFFTSGGQNIGASATVLPMNRTDFLYDWLVGSPCSPRDSRESSPTPQFKSISLSTLSFLYGPTLTSIRDYWKNHSFDLMDLCPQSNDFAF